MYRFSSPVSTTFPPWDHWEVPYFYRVRRWIVHNLSNTGDDTFQLTPGLLPFGLTLDLLCRHCGFHSVVHCVHLHCQDDERISL